jgi:DNA-binding response OmpR family regulator
MKKVLIVEDEPSIANIYKLKLEKSGYSCRIVYSGLDVMPAIAEFKPDVVLLDLMLPGLMGDKVLAKIRSQKEHRDLPVIVITNVSKNEAPRTLWHLGIHDYIVKASYTPAMVVEIVDRVLNNQAAAKLKPTTL